MDLIVDLHIHSRFAYATSKAITIEGIYRWCKIKGINIIGTSDFTHPEWFKELTEYLEPAEQGLYKLKGKYAKKIDKELPQSVRNNLVRFIFAVEISNIYTKKDRVRKMHNLVIMPSLEDASELNSRLAKVGNLKADGRPILGIDSKELLKITLETSPEGMFIPAHIWTPWFSLFGSRSGFDSVEESFEELSSEIKAIETGLSSDPFMNWRLSALSGMTIVSNSDAHSLPKMAREANIMKCQPVYNEIIGALKTNDKRMIGTIEFYPQEGMYHFDGHRKCGIRFSPEETKKHKGICPKCGLPLVVGVMHRVDEIADKPADFKPEKHKRVEYIIPLVEIIGELKGIKSAGSKAISTEYERIYSKLGSEFEILRGMPVEEIKNSGFYEIAEAVRRMREGKIYIEEGYDGVYGRIKVFESDGEKTRSLGGQQNFHI